MRFQRERVLRIGATSRLLLYFPGCLYFFDCVRYKYWWRFNNYFWYYRQVTRVSNVNALTQAPVFGGLAVSAQIFLCSVWLYVIGYPCKTTYIILLLVGFFNPVPLFFTRKLLLRTNSRNFFHLWYMYAISTIYINFMFNNNCFFSTGCSYFLWDFSGIIQSTSVYA